MPSDISIEEDFPGQEKEWKRQQALTTAVMAADRILMDHADGNRTELELVTAEMAKLWASKVWVMIQGRSDLDDLLKRT